MLVDLGQNQFSSVSVFSFASYIGRFSPVSAEDMRVTCGLRVIPDLRDRGIRLVGFMYVVQCGHLGSQATSEPGFSLFQTKPRYQNALPGQTPIASEAYDLDVPDQFAYRVFFRLSQVLTRVD